jgi:hypothetical protein
VQGRVEPQQERLSGRHLTDRASRC